MTRPALATTSLESYWPADGELLFLGPWCLGQGKSGGPAGRPWRMLPNVWDDRAFLAESARECSRHYEQLMGPFAAALDAAHGTRHGERYWDILAGPWLLFHIHHLYDRWTQLRRALALHPDACMTVLPAADYFVPRDSAEFLWAFHTPQYDLQLYSHAARALGADAAPRPEKILPPPPPERTNATPSRRIKDLLRDVALRVCDSALRAGMAPVATDELYPSGRLYWKFALRSGFKVLPVFRPSLEDLRADAVFDSRRNALAGLPANDDFGRLLVASLPLFLPTSYLESYAARRERCTLGRDKTPAVVFAGVSLYYDDAMKFVAAEWTSRGARLLGLQHGGQYGTAAYSLAEEHERRISDRYFTWGWSKTEGDPCLGDLPIPKWSESPRRSSPPSSSEVLVVGAEGLKNAHHLFPYPMGLQWDRYLSQRCAFVSSLPNAERARVRIRLSPQDYGWRQRERMLERLPGLRFDDSGIPFSDSVERAAIVVTDHPGTTFLELLATNKPSLHFWDPGLWETRPSARAAIDALAAAGIVHFDPASAAAQIVRVGNDPNAWWESLAVQSARQAFVRDYARVSKDWAGEWAAIIAAEVAATRAS